MSGERMLIWTWERGGFRGRVYHSKDAMVRKKRGMKMESFDFLLKERESRQCILSGESPVRRGEAFFKI